MFNKIISVAGLTGVLALTALVAGPAKAQLAGHDTYGGGTQMNMSDYVIGRVRGTVGGIMSVQFKEPVTVGNEQVTLVNVSGDGAGGDDVLFQVVDGKLVYAGKAHPTWISRLKLK